MDGRMCLTSIIQLKTKSQFTISKAELRALLTSKEVVKTPITRTLESSDGVRYVRDVLLKDPVGTDKYNNFQPSRRMTVLTDRKGNLITASPGVLK